ncbi:MFS-type transporter [Paramyrothecium foliicola]|nr:MFS-type transporter [Paramyrothecium foliicola]
MGGFFGAPNCSVPPPKPILFSRRTTTRLSKLHNSLRNGNNNNNNNNKNDCPGCRSLLPAMSTPADATTPPELEAGHSTSPKNDSKANAIGERPACFRNTLQEVSFVFMATIGMATNTFLVGATVIVTAAIGKDLGMSQSQISWIGAATTLTAGAFQLSLGQLSDFIGRKVMFLSGMCIFSLGCLITAFAQNPFWMNIMCGVLGLASAMVVPPAIGILGAAYAVPSRRKNWAFACFSAGNPLGFAVGSLATGIAARIFNWRAGFILLCIIWAIFFVACFWVVPSVEAFEPSPFLARAKTALKKFDSVGTVLTVFGVGMLTAGLTLGPGDGWASGHVIAMMVVGLALLVLFVFWESYWPQPLMPLYVWKNRNFSLLIAITCLGSSAFISSNFWLPLLMQEVRHMDALAVAVQLLPQVIAGIIWNIVAAAILHKVNNTLIMAVGAVAYVGSSIILSFQQANSLYWAFVFPALVIAVIGADFQFNVTNMYVMQSLPSHQQGLAGGIFNMTIRLGSTIALGLSTAVYESVRQAQGEHGDPMVPYHRAFNVSIGIAGLSCFMLPFLRIGTQGNAPHEEESDLVETGQKGNLPSDAENSHQVPIESELVGEKTRI